VSHVAIDSGLVSTEGLRESKPGNGQTEVGVWLVVVDKTAELVTMRWRKRGGYSEEMGQLQLQL
jgi:hypothetical protein